MPVTYKKPWLSKTIILNAFLAVVGAVAAFYPQANVVSEFVHKFSGEIGMVWGMLNMIIRLITKDKITLQD